MNMGALIMFAFVSLVAIGALIYYHFEVKLDSKSESE